MVNRHELDHARRAPQLGCMAPRFSPHHPRTSCKHLHEYSISTINCRSIAEDCGCLECLINLHMALLQPLGGASEQRMRQLFQLKCGVQIAMLNNSS